MQHKHLHFVVVAVVVVCCMRVEQQKVRDPISMPQRVPSAERHAGRQEGRQAGKSCSTFRFRAQIRETPFGQHFNLPLRWQH